jgi:hypothetical protein
MSKEKYFKILTCEFFTVTLNVAVFICLISSFQADRFHLPSTTPIQVIITFNEKSIFMYHLSCFILLRTNIILHKYKIPFLS